MALTAMVLVPLLMLGLTGCDSSDPGGQPGTCGGCPLIASQVSASEAHGCALTTSGSIECWGENTLHMLGTETMDNAPAAAPAVGIHGATAIAVGVLQTCAIVTGGAVACWGANFHVLPGTGSKDAWRPALVPGLRGATAVASG